MRSTIHTTTTTNTTTTTTDIITATGNPTLNNNAITISPNPSGQDFTITLNGTFSWKVVDAAGRFIGKGNAINRFTTGDKLLPGLYFLILTQKNKSITRTLIKL